MYDTAACMHACEHVTELKVAQKVYAAGRSDARQDRMAELLMAEKCCSGLRLVLLVCFVMVVGHKQRFLSKPVFHTEHVAARSKQCIYIYMCCKVAAGAMHRIMTCVCVGTDESQVRCFPYACMPAARSARPQLSPTRCPQSAAPASLSRCRKG